MMFYLPSCLLYVIGHILTNQELCCWADGGFKKLKIVRRQFFLSHLLPYSAILSYRAFALV